tara:strand:+ start:103 stop:579 length:477 start_codon:yes stop_codon:yes gene_type:complete
MSEIIFNKVGRIPQVIEDRTCIYIPLLSGNYGVAVGGLVESLNEIGNYLSNFGIDVNDFNEEDRENYSFRSCVVDELDPIRKFPGDVFDSDVLIPHDVVSRNHEGLLEVVLETAFRGYRNLSENVNSYNGDLSFAIDLRELALEDESMDDLPGWKNGV